MEVLNKSHFSLQMGICPIHVAEHFGHCLLSLFHQASQCISNLHSFSNHPMGSHGYLLMKTKASLRMGQPLGTNVVLLHCSLKSLLTYLGWYILFSVQCILLIETYSNSMALCFIFQALYSLHATSLINFGFSNLNHMELCYLDLELKSPQLHFEQWFQLRSFFF